MTEPRIWTQSNWRIEMILDRLCLDCVLNSDPDSFPGATINRDDQLLLIRNIDVVGRDECDFKEDHEA